MYNLKKRFTEMRTVLKEKKGKNLIDVVFKKCNLNFRQSVTAKTELCLNYHTLF